MIKRPTRPGPPNAPRLINARAPTPPNAHPNARQRAPTRPIMKKHPTIKEFNALKAEVKRLRLELDILKSRQPIKPVAPRKLSPRERILLAHEKQFKRKETG